MAIKLPNDKICYNLPEQVAANADNIASLAEQWNSYKEELDTEWGGYKTAFESYSYQWENEILPAFNDIPNQVLGIIEDNDTVAKTLIQKQPNFEQEISVNPEAAALNGATLTGSYYKLIQLGNILYIVCAVGVKNETGSSITVNWDSLLTRYDLTLEDGIADKIYDVNGKKVSENGSANILYTPGFAGSSATQNYVAHASAGKIHIRMNGSTTVPAGGTSQYSCRTFIVLA